MRLSLSVSSSSTHSLKTQKAMLGEEAAIRYNIVIHIGKISSSKIPSRDTMVAKHDWAYSKGNRRLRKSAEIHQFFQACNAIAKVATYAGAREA